MPPRLFTQPGLDVHQRRPAEDGLGQSGVAEGVALVAGTLRLEGQIDRRGGRATAALSKEAREENLTWALGKLREAHETDPTSLSEARLAEAMVLFEDQREQAATMLQGMADADVMPDTYAYRTLTLVQRALGHDDLARSASRACILNASMRELPLCPVLG